MKISFANIGPVRRANVTLSPLVMFVGPNNSGKSVLASAIYAALSQTGVATTPRIRRPIADVLQISEDEIAEEFNEYLSGVGPAKKPPYDLLPDRLKQYFGESLNRSLLEYLISVSEEVSRATGLPLHTLRRTVRRRATKAMIEISSDSPAWSVRLDIDSREVFHVNVNKRATLDEIWPRVGVNFWRRYLQREVSITRAPTLPLKEVSAELIRICFRQVPQHSYYLPASRSGIIQSRRNLAGSLVRRTSLPRHLDVQDSGMTGIATDFLSQIIELNPANIGRYADEARGLEEDILHGHLMLPGEPGTYPEFIYNTDSGDFRIANASSMVSEVAPIVLYLRHLLRRNELLIIEEPETSLHPGVQIVLARSLVHLVNKGLRILLTTHSEFFLQQINNAIIAAGMKPEEAAAAGFAHDYVLSSSKVAAYLFDPSPEGTEVRELAINPNDGISDSTFSTVSRQLYNEAVALEGSAERAEQ